VLGELHWYTHQDPLPNDVSTAKETLLYLEACNLLFEQGFLSHDQVRSADAKVLMNIDKGFSYFTDWLDSLLKIGMYTLKPLLDTTLKFYETCCLQGAWYCISYQSNCCLFKKLDSKMLVVYREVPMCACPLLKCFFDRSKLSTHNGHTEVFSVMAK